MAQRDGPRSATRQDVHRVRPWIADPVERSFTGASIARPAEPVAPLGEPVGPGQQGLAPPPARHLAGRVAVEQRRPVVLQRPQRAADLHGDGRPRPVAQLDLLAGG